MISQEWKIFKKKKKTQKGQLWTLAWLNTFLAISSRRIQNLVPQWISQTNLWRTESFLSCSCWILGPQYKSSKGRPTELKQHLDVVSKTEHVFFLRTSKQRHRRPTRWDARMDLDGRQREVKKGRTSESVPVAGLAELIWNQVFSPPADNRAEARPGSHFRLSGLSSDVPTGSWLNLAFYSASRLRQWAPSNPAEERGRTPINIEQAAKPFTAY